MHQRRFLISVWILLVTSFMLFLVGFFPVKNVLPGVASHKNYSLGNVTLQQPKPAYDRLVVVLVDALRSDFVTAQHNMEFVRQQLQDGKGDMFTLRAHPPTVTLPRIKALTSGTIPGFVDVVLNFESSSLQEDNIITQAHRTGRNIVFYGDDTWLKLFPQHFIRSEGTTSFFVTDYTEVDDNVTRHLDEELSAPDWDLMVLHYLGLDHIGHTVGPKSSLVPPKLQEMDTIIKLIHNRLESQSQRSLILLCGDHGMSDQGSHGGASDWEVLVPAVFLTPGRSSGKNEWNSQRELLQIDLAPTLALLMGLPIPVNNLGQALIGALQGLSILNESELLDALYVNCHQIFTLLEKNLPSVYKESSYDLYQRAVALHGRLLNQSSADTDVTMVMRAYEQAMDAMATKLSASLTNYDIYSMVAAISIQILCLVSLMCYTMQPQIGGDIKVMTSYTSVFITALVVVPCHVTICTSTNQSYTSSCLCKGGYLNIVIQCLVFAALQFLIGFLAATEWRNIRLFVPKSILQTMLISGTLLHSLSFGSSSCVEEEHQTWYFLVMTFNLVALVTQVIHAMRTSAMKKSDKFNKINKTFGQYDEYGDGHVKSTENCALAYRAYEQKDEHQRVEQDIIGTNECFKNYASAENRKVDKQTYKHPFRHMLPWKQLIAGVTIMLLGRCMRMLNQTGNKWLDTPDIGDWLARPENKLYLSISILLSIVSIFVAKRPHDLIDMLLFGAGLLCCYGYRLVTGSVDMPWIFENSNNKSAQGILEARLAYLSAGALFCWAVYQYVQKYHIVAQDQRHNMKVTLVGRLQLSWIIIMTLLLRPHNTVLVAMVIIQEVLLWKYLLRHISLPVESLTLYCWWMGQAVFFQQGNSNSLSTVDVSAGYVGLSDYQPVLVCTLLFCSTYAGPIYWILALVKYLNIATDRGDKSTKRESVGGTIRRQQTNSSCVLSLILERTFTIGFYSVVVLSQRYHLFVWTVFSPKLLYEANVCVIGLVFSVLILFQS